MRETRGKGNCIGIGIALSFALSLSWHFVGRGVHTVGHASPPLDAASWRRSSAFSSARRLSSAVGSSAPSGSGSSSEERGAGAGGRGDPRADFEPAILPFQGMRRQAVAADHFHSSKPTRVSGPSLRPWHLATGRISGRASPTGRAGPYLALKGQRQIR